MSRRGDSEQKVGERPAPGRLGRGIIKGRRDDLGRWERWEGVRVVSGVDGVGVRGVRGEGVDNGEVAAYRCAGRWSAR